jgi:hypothetical protein
MSSSVRGIFDSVVQPSGSHPTPHRHALVLSKYDGRVWSHAHWKNARPMLYALFRSRHAGTPYMAQSVFTHVTVRRDLSVSTKCSSESLAQKQHRFVVLYSLINMQRQY